MQFKPTTVTKEQALKVVKAGFYIALSGAIAALLSWAADNKDALGVLWPLMNLLLVMLKQVFTPVKT
jgi:hypothetical protein